MLPQDEVTHQISELIMGCHSDSGFEHQARSFYAQMIVPDSFNATGFTPSPHWGGNASTDGSFSSARVGWNVEKSAPSVAFAHGTDNSSRFHGVASERLSLAGKGSGGLSNRGLGNAGMAFEAGKPYEGFIWAGAAGASSVVLTVSLEDYTVTPNKVLAAQTFTVQPTTTATAHRIQPAGCPACRSPRACVWSERTRSGRSPCLEDGTPITKALEGSEKTTKGSEN